MKEQITKYLCERNEKFLQYHTGSADSTVNEVQEYFESGTFITSEVCDFLISVIAEVFNLTIHVYQKKPDGNVQVHKFSPDTPEKEVHLKFTHDSAASGGNHYDCIVRTSLAKKEICQSILSFTTSSIYFYRNPVNFCRFHFTVQICWEAHTSFNCWCIFKSK